MKTVAIGILGNTMDRRGRRDNRWAHWRPTVSICQHDDLLVDRLELLLDNHSQGLAQQVRDDIKAVSPETEVVFHKQNFKDPWDFETVYSDLLDFAQSYQFNTQNEKYLIHITTGTHVAQICWYLLTEAGYLPGQLLQTAPPRRNESVAGHYQIIDLDLSRYDLIASRFKKEHEQGTDYLKSGIATLNPAFNKMIDQLERVSVKSEEPILLTGPTGAGKSQLAQRVYDLRRQRGRISGKLVTVNCATLRGENAMSALFGHTKGAFTGATSQRAGLLKQADSGLLFLDEIGELGLDEQAMLLRAIEEKQFLPLGADQEHSSEFQLIAGTNKNLALACKSGEFREDLLARINLWTYKLPSLSERREDIEPNIDYELENWARRSGDQVRFNTSARKKYLRFAMSDQASWAANFRDLNASIIRMATLAEGARINDYVVEDEVKRLQESWASHGETQDSTLEHCLSAAQIAELDYFDKVQLNSVIDVCQNSKSMADAGRKLFAVSRMQKQKANDSHRLKQYLSRFDLQFDQL